MMTHQNMVFAAGSRSRSTCASAPDDRILSVLPLAFDYGLYQLLMTVRIGATLVLERSFAFPAQIAEARARGGGDGLPGRADRLRDAALDAAPRTLELPTVRRVTNTAAALPPTFHDELREIFPNALIFRMYGLTECKRV